MKQVIRLPTQVVNDKGRYHPRIVTDVDSFARLEYAVLMTAPTHQDIESQVRGWIRKNTKENSRLEFKLRIVLDTSAAKAEFIRDVIALANSEGEFPRADAYLVIGVKNGKRQDVRGENYNGAVFGQILDAHVYPSIRTDYMEFGGKTRTGVLVVRGNADAIHAVSKRLPGEKGQILLWPGQCWGRKSDRKIELDGQAIHVRQRTILDRKMADATAPLEARIEKLEREAGPALEVKRIRFAIEGTQDWSVMWKHVNELFPYAREFDYGVKNEVVDALLEVSGRTRDGMPVSVAQLVDSVLGELMPVGFGGLLHPAGREISKEKLDLLERIEHVTFELAWDACRYLRDLEIVEVTARRYWSLIRFATLNGLQKLQAESLKNARNCAEICNEERDGKPLSEGRRYLEERIKDAQDVSQGSGRRISRVSTQRK